MRADCLWNGRAGLLVGVAALALVACGSSKKSGSTIHVEGGAGNGGSGGAATGGTGGIAGQGGTSGQGGAAGQGGQGTGGAGGAASCSDFGQTSGCTTCLEKSCCAESAACSADASCKAFVACAEKCPDPIHNTTSTCMTACKEAGAPGGAYNNLLICMEQKCTSSCTYP